MDSSVLIAKESLSITYFAALHTPSDILDIFVGVRLPTCEPVFIVLAMFDKRGWLGSLKTFLTTGNSGGLDSIDDGRTLRRYLNVSLVATKEHC